jgi:hypothetical protein
MLAVLLVWVMALVVGSNAGGLYEGLTLLNLSDESIAGLPGGQVWASLLANPTFRSYTAMALATSLLAVEGLAVIAGFHVLGAWSRAKEQTLRAFAREHVVLVTIAGILLVIIGCAMTLDVTLWMARAHADVALGSVGRKAAWFASDNGTGESVADSAHRIAPLGAVAFFALGGGLAVGAHLVGYLLIHCASHLAQALDTLKKVGLGDAWLDAVERVVKGKGLREFVSRRTAVTNPDEYTLDARGRVFAQSLVEELRAIDLRTLAAVVVAAVFLATSAQAAAPVMTPSAPIVARAAYEPPAVFLKMVLDLSGTTAKTREERVGHVRETLREVAATADNDVRRTPSPRVLIKLTSVDAFGGELLWEGTEQSVSELTEEWWQRTLASRRSYGGCSEFAEVWRQFESFASWARSCDEVFLLFFSDLIVEEATSRSTTVCRPKVFGPPAGVPWSALERATTRAYYVPDSSKKAWETPLRAHGLAGRFQMFSGFDPSGRVPLPLREVLARTACAPDAATKAATVSGIKRLAVIAAVAIAAVIALPFLLSRS